MAVTSDLCSSDKFGSIFKNSVKKSIAEVGDSASEVGANANDKEMVMHKG